jgi:predicted ABC-type ATPase
MALYQSDVPETDVRRRFDRSIKNFLVLFRTLADSSFLFDNSLRTPSGIALEEQGRLHMVKPDAYNTLVTQYENPD